MLVNIETFITFLLKLKNIETSQRITGDIDKARKMGPRIVLLISLLDLIISTVNQITSLLNNFIRAFSNI